MLHANSRQGTLKEYVAAFSSVIFYLSRFIEVKKCRLGNSRSHNFESHTINKILDRIRKSEFQIRSLSTIK